MSKRKPLRILINKISGITEITGKQNTVKITRKNHHLEAKDSSKLLLHSFDICTFQSRVSSKMTDFQKCGLIKNVLSQIDIFHFQSLKEFFLFLGKQISFGFVILDWKMVLVASSVFIWCHIPRLKAKQFFF